MDDNEIAQLAKEKGLTPEQLKAVALSAFGTLGGKSGRGDSKRRSPECYQKAVAARNKQREQRRKAKEAAKKEEEERIWKHFKETGKLPKK